MPREDLIFNKTVSARRHAESELAHFYNQRGMPNINEDMLEKCIDKYERYIKTMIAAESILDEDVD